MDPFICVSVWWLLCIFSISHGYHLHYFSWYCIDEKETIAHKDIIGKYRNLYDCRDVYDVRFMGVRSGSSSCGSIKNISTMCICIVMGKYRR